MLATAIYVLAFLILVGLAFWVLSQLPIPEPIKKVIYIVMVVVVVILIVMFLLQFVGAGPFFPTPAHR